MRNELKHILGRKDSRLLINFMQEYIPIKANFIMRKLPINDKLLQVLNEDMQEFLGYHKDKPVFAMLKKILFTIGLHDLLLFWVNIYNERLTQKNELKIKPIIERKDNGTFINKGSGYGNRNKIRYPNKCRKTAWKRFYRLFPHLDKTNEKITN